MSALLLERILKYFRDTESIFRAGQDNVSRVRVTTLVFLLLELYHLVVYCDFMSAL